MKFLSVLGRLSLAVLLAAPGCLKVKEHLTLKADGSGTVVLETRCQAPAAAVEMLKQRSRMGEFSYPPLTEDDARDLFPEGVFEVKVEGVRGEDAVSGTLVTASFKDINAVMNSPYGRARALTVRVEGGKLTVSSLSGLLLAVAAADSEQMQRFPAAADLAEKKHLMAAEFKLTLPGTIEASNGTHGGTTAAWTFDRSKTKSMAEAAKLFAGAMRASCPAAGIAFTPRPPARLGLGSFDEIKEGPLPDPPKAPDAKAVAGAARFVPVLLDITRSFDLAGDGGGMENQAVLRGAVVLPRALAPDQWGDARLAEVLDDKGKNLARGQEGDDEPRYRRSRFSDDFSPDGREGKPSADARHFVALDFKVPDATVKKLAKVRGEITLEYLTQREVVKLPQAFPKERVKVQRPEEYMEAEGGEKALSHPRLAALGLKLVTAGVTSTEGFSHLTLRFEGKRADLDDVRLFDAQGTGWPSILADREMGPESGYCQVFVLGAPEPPLSLVLLLATAHSEVKLPIQLENVPISGPPPEPEGDKPKEK